MQTFVTSDLHINHANILKFCPETRPFSCVEEMNETLVSNWNKKVKHNDRVYILGDVAFGDVNDAVKILSRLNGDKILIVGNHDHKNLKVKEFYDQFAEVTPYHTEKFDGKMVVMFHFPIEYWDKSHHGSFHLHGHLHSKNPEILTKRRFDVGVDGNECMVHNIRELLDYIEKKVPHSGASHHR